MEDLRYVLITGSTSGIGLGLASRLLESGYGVIGLGRRPPPDCLKSNKNYHQFQIDLSDPFAIEGIDDGLKNYKGKLCGLIYCAGSAILKRVAECSDIELIRQINVNLLGAMLCARRVLRYGHPTGIRIIFLGSRSRRFAFDMGAAYCASKAGLFSLNDCIALEAKMIHRNVKTSIIELGTVATGFAGKPVTSAQIPTDSVVRHITEHFEKGMCSDFESRIIEIVPSSERFFHD